MKNKKNTILEEYQTWVKSKWTSKKNKRKYDLRDNYIMTAGLGGETGEVLEILKKSVRDGKFDKDHLTEELGDVFYYLTMICTVHKISLREVVDMNIDKLEKRYPKM